MNVYEIITQQILDKLDQGTVPWHRPWIGGQPKNLVSGKEYTGINPFLLGCTGYSSPYWVTYKQAQKKGGNVKKGEKSSMVVFWKRLAPKLKTDPETGEVKETAGWVLRYYRVFNVDQCDGIETPDDGHKLDFEPIKQCETVTNNMPNSPQVEHKEPRAYYRPDQDTVNMPAKERFLSTEEYYSTLFHELTHSTGHKSRLNRHETEKCNHLFDTKNYSKEELVAEMGAAFLCGHCAIENKTIDNSAAYIKNWARKFKDKPKMVIYAAAAAQKAVDYIMGKKATA